MASAYSTPIQYKPYESNVDVQFITQALAYKQQKYDANYDKLQNFYQNMANVDFVKEEDRQAFFNKLNNLRDDVDKFGMGDLSQTGVSENIMSHIGQAADEKTLNGYYGTLAIRKIQKEAEKAKEKGTFDIKNYNFSMREAASWLNDGTAGSEYKGGSSYIPFVDMYKEANKIVKDLAPDVTVSLTPMGNFTYLKKNGEVLSDAKVIQALDMAISSNSAMQQQLQVNSWDSFKDITDQDFVKNARELINSQVSSLDKRIEEMNTQKTLFPNKANEYNEVIDYLKTQKNSLNRTDEELLNNRESIQATIYKQNFLNDAAQIFAYEKIKDMSLVTDQGALAVYKEQRVQARHEDNMSLKREQLDAKNVAETNKTAKRIRDLVAKGNLSEAENLANVNNMQDVYVDAAKATTKLAPTTEVMDKTVQYDKVFENYEEKVNNYDKNIETLMEQFWTALVKDDDQLNDLRITTNGKINQRKASYQFKNHLFDKEGNIKKEFLEQKLGNGNFNFEAINIAEQIKTLEKERDGFITNLSDLNSTIIARKEADAAQKMEEFKGTPLIFEQVPGERRTVQTKNTLGTSQGAIWYNTDKKSWVILPKSSAGVETPIAEEDVLKLVRDNIKTEAKEKEAFIDRYNTFYGDEYTKSGLIVTTDNMTNVNILSEIMAQKGNEFPQLQSVDGIKKALDNKESKDRLTNTVVKYNAITDQFQVTGKLGSKDINVSFSPTELPSTTIAVQVLNDIMFQTGTMKRMKEQERAMAIDMANNNKIVKNEVSVFTDTQKNALIEATTKFTRSGANISSATTTFTITKSDGRAIEITENDIRNAYQDIPDAGNAFQNSQLIKDLFFTRIYPQLNL
jgi:hypothetical protein